MKLGLLFDKDSHSQLLRLIFFLLEQLIDMPDHVA